MQWHKALTHLGDGSSEAKVAVLAVHVVRAGARVVAEPVHVHPGGGQHEWRGSRGTTTAVVSAATPRRRYTAGEMGTNSVAFLPQMKGNPTGCTAGRKPVSRTTPQMYTEVVHGMCASGTWETTRNKNNDQLTRCQRS